MDLSPTLPELRRNTIVILEGGSSASEGEIVWIEMDQRLVIHLISERLTRREIEKTGVGRD